MSGLHLRFRVGPGLAAEVSVGLAGNGALTELELAEAEGRDFDLVPRSSTRFAMLGGTRAELERLLELGPGVFGRQGVLARARELASVDRRTQP